MKGNTKTFSITKLIVATMHRFNHVEEIYTLLINLFIFFAEKEQTNIIRRGYQAN